MPDELASDSGSWKVFISYSWDDEDHKRWVLDFAKRLRGDGIDTVLDQTHLHFGGRTPEFMERSVRESRSVLVICTEGYKARFDGRKGGVGYEGHIITAEILNSAGTEKFIPVLRHGDWNTAMPTALGSVYGADLRTDSTETYRDLVRHLHGVNDVPAVGPPPDWLHPDKARPPVEATINPIVEVPRLIVTPQEYWDQRKRLPKSDLVERIWQKPNWCLWSRPEDFKKARFRDLRNCAEFVASASVRSHARWSQYPWFAKTPDQDVESISSGIEIAEGSVKHLEQWVLFQSGQFVHNMALDEIPQLGDRTHVLEILDTTTALLEFVGKMADHKVFSDRVVVTFELKKVAGRQLTWPQDILRMEDRVNDQAWSQDESIAIEKLYSAADLRTRRRSLAMDVAIEIYSQFGWNEPPKKDLEAKQRERFGPPLGV